MEKTLEQRFFSRFTDMKTRCYNPNCRSYHAYGGRGITVERKNKQEFYDDMRQSFVEHVQKHGIDDTTIDRIYVNGNYCKENCRWITRKEQTENKRTVIPVIYKGKKYTSIKTLADEKGLDHRLVRARMQRGRDIEKAIDTPAKDMKGNKIIYQGVEYKSYRALCRALGIPKDRIWRGLRHGYTIEECIIKKTNSFKHNKATKCTTSQTKSIQQSIQNDKKILVNT